MSLRTRLVVSIVTLVMCVVVALSALSLYGVATVKFGDLQERAMTAALQAQSLLLRRIDERMKRGVTPTRLNELKALWIETASTDQELPSALNDIMASSKSILEIEVAGENRRILASSNPASVGKKLEPLPKLVDWARKKPWSQLLEIFTQRLNYQVILPLGVEGRGPPVFQIQVVISSVLLRNSLMPQINYLAKVIVISALAALILAVGLASLSVRPLARIGEAIDRMARGDYRPEVIEQKEESKEFATLQSKLNVLGQQFRGVHEDTVTLRNNIGQLLDKLGGAVLLFDKNDRMIMAGSAVENLLGRGRWELMGRQLDELFPASSPLGAVVQSAVQFRRVVKDFPSTIEGDRQPATRVLISVEPLEDFPNRDKLGTLITLRDAESRAHLASQLDVSARLAAISRLTGGVAHEIKNPLNAIALHLEVLKAKAGDALEIEDEIRILSTEVARLDRVVKTFLDFNRPVQLERRTIDLTSVVGEVVELVKPEAGKRNVDVQIETAGEVLISGDRDLIKQAVLNVVNNAVEASKETGKVGIAVERNEQECTVRVSDQGEGIPPEIGDKIFNLYFSTKSKGSGIGLALTFRAVQLHGGTIDFSSVCGEGTTFWLRFPALTEGRAQTGQVPATSSGTRTSGEDCGRGIMMKA
jgi:signal transduction histidine kinase